MLLEYAKTFKDKKVGFIGLGVSNTPILRLLMQAGAVCSVRDMKALPPEEAEALTREGVAIHCGETYLEGIDEEYLFLSPAVRSDLPKLAEAKELTRKARTRRLCTRGGMLESFLEAPNILTDDDVMEFLTCIFDFNSVQRKLNQIIVDRTEAIMAEIEAEAEEDP